MSIYQFDEQPIHREVMRLAQLVLVVAVVLLVCSDGIVAKRDRQNLLSFDGVEYEERRRSKAGAIAAGRVGSVTTTTENGNGGGTVTVTTYNSDGLWQRIKRCWKRLIGYEERLRLRGISTGNGLRAAGITSGNGPRVGAGGTVVISDDNNGGGTVKVTVFNNNGLFQKIKRWWRRIFQHEASRSARRLRRLTTA